MRPIPLTKYLTTSWGVNAEFLVLNGERLEGHE